MESKNKFQQEIKTAYQSAKDKALSACNLHQYRKRPPGRITWNSGNPEDWPGAGKFEPELVQMAKAHHASGISWADLIADLGLPLDPLLPKRFSKLWARVAGKTPKPKEVTYPSGKSNVRVTRPDGTVIEMDLSLEEKRSLLGMC